MICRTAYSVLMLAAASGLSTWALQQDTPRADDSNTLTQAAFSRLVEHEQLVIREALKAAVVDWKAVHNSAVLIGLAAHQRIGFKGANDRQLAAVRDQAMRLTETTDLVQARKLAAALSPATKEQADPAQVPARLRDFLEIDMLHGMMRKRSGLGIESDFLQAAARKQPLTQKQREHLLVQAYRTVVIAEATQGSLRNALARKGVPKGLEAWATEMRTAALEVASALPAREDRDVRAALVKLNTSCTVCHNFFRGGALPAPPVRKK